MSTLISVALSHDDADRLGVESGSLSDMKFPELSPPLLKVFCRALFDVAATISRPEAGELRIRLPRPGSAILDGLVEYTQVVPSKLGKNAVHFRGVGALDLLGILYDGARTNQPGESRLFRPKLLSRYEAWACRIAQLAPVKEPAVLAVQRLREDAVVPQKGRISDSGYDLTIVHAVRTHGNITLFGTGLSVDPPQGWYFDVIARSSLIKLGYMMANSVGVIDRAYRGEIMVPLVKVDPNAPDITLPARVAQLIPRPIVHFPVVERSELTFTHRGTGGFGSTGPA
jgi:deoxyuridine 5'-triphosphate nucleotidohydrolase